MVEQISQDMLNLANESQIEADCQENHPVDCLVIVEEESKEKITTDWEHVEIRQVNHTTSSNSILDQQNGKVDFGDEI